MATNLFTTKLSRRVAIAGAVCAGTVALAAEGKGKGRAAPHDPLVALWNEWAELDIETDRLMKACPKDRDTEVDYLETRVDPLLDRAFAICEQVSNTDAKTLEGIAAQARFLNVEVERYDSCTVSENMAARLTATLDRMVSA